MSRTLQRAIVAIDNPPPCEDCERPMTLVLEIRESEFWVPGELSIFPWPEWVCEACEMGYSFEYDDLTAEDLGKLEAEEERLAKIAIRQLDSEADEARRLAAIAKRKADRQARLDRRRR